ncbi:MAG: late competence development ComFB family protein [Succinivibrionaceae bacterium]
MSKIGEIHNYYETLVSKHIDALELTLTKDQDYLTDLFCLSLNQLPAYYIRYGVDMLYFTSDKELQNMEDQVSEAVNNAINWLADKNHQRKNE